MAFSDNLISTATKLIKEYGNTITISTTTNDGVYNPQTGSYGSPVVQEYSKMAAVSTVTTKELQNSGLPENEWGSVNAVYTMIEDTETSLLDNKWKIDDLYIKKVSKIQTQNKVVIIKVYVGI